MGYYDTHYNDFLTKPFYAERIISQLNLSSYDQIIEPCAGTGSFSNLIPNCIALDIKPRHKSITCQDFFTFTTNSSLRNLIIGSPPFGKEGEIAADFFNHAAKFATTIAFIMPIQYLRPSYQNKLDRHFELARTSIMPTTTFMIEIKNIDHPIEVFAPCVFQVWEKSDELRQLPLDYQLSDYLQVVPRGLADICVAKTGKYAGKATEVINGSSKTTYFFMNTSNKTNSEMVEFINSLEFPSLMEPMKNYRPLSKEELFMIINQNWS